MMEEMSREWIEEFHEKSEMERNPDVREERMENFLKWFAKGETPEEIDLRIYSSSTEVLFLIRPLDPDEGNDSSKCRVESPSSDFLMELEAKRSTFIQPIVRIQKELLQSFNPVLLSGEKSTVRLRNDHARPSDLRNLVDEGLIDHAPILFDLIHYYRRHLYDDSRVDEIEIDGETFIELKARSIRQMTSVRSRKAVSNAKKELHELTSKKFHFIYETEKSLRRRKGGGSYEVVEIISKNRFSPIIISVDIDPVTGRIVVIAHEFLVRIDHHSKSLPMDIRNRWNEWGPRSKVTRSMRLASAWSWMQRRRSVVVRVEKFMNVCDIRRDKRNPKRIWERLTSVLSWLVDTLEITSYGLFMVWDKDERLPKHETNDIETARYIRLRMEGSTHPFKEEYGDPPESLMEEGRVEKTAA